MGTDRTKKKRPSSRAHRPKGESRSTPPRKTPSRHPDGGGGGTAAPMCPKRRRGRMGVAPATESQPHTAGCGPAGRAGTTPGRRRGRARPPPTRGRRLPRRTPAPGMGCVGGETTMRGQCPASRARPRPPPRAAWARRRHRPGTEPARTATSRGAPRAPCARNHHKCAPVCSEPDSGPRKGCSEGGERRRRRRSRARPSHHRAGASPKRRGRQRATHFVEQKDSARASRDSGVCGACARRLTQ